MSESFARYRQCAKLADEFHAEGDIAAVDAMLEEMDVIWLHKLTDEERTLLSAEAASALGGD